MFSITSTNAQNSRNSQRNRKQLGLKQASGAGDVGETTKQHSAISKPNISNVTRLIWKPYMRSIHLQPSDREAKLKINSASNILHGSSLEK